MQVRPGRERSAADAAGVERWTGAGGFEGQPRDHSRRQGRPEGRRYEPPRPRGPHVVMIDNYDSFTFTLVQYLLELGAVVDVYSNDALAPDDVFAIEPSHLVLSPGPGHPADSGICQALSRRVCEDGSIPTLGVCLGHQTLCEVHGATVRRAERIMHGKVSSIEHDGTGVLRGLATPMTVTRYHSLIVDEATLPATLVPSARTARGELMAVRHRVHPVYGVQFHPESILSEHGHRLLANFLSVERSAERGAGNEEAARLDRNLRA